MRDEVYASDAVAGASSTSVVTSRGAAKSEAHGLSRGKGIRNGDKLRRTKEISPLLNNFRMSRPKRPIQGAVLDGFGDVFGLKGDLALQIGDGSGDFEDAVVGAGGESLLNHGALEQALAIGGEFAEGADVPRSHLGVAIELVAGRGGESLELNFARADDTGPDCS